MGETKNTISAQLEQWLREKNNFIEIIGKLNEITSTNKDTVEVDLTTSDDTIETIQLPSIGFIKAQIDRLDANIQTLSGLEDSDSIVRLPDGSFKKVFEAQILRDPQPIGNVVVPEGFKIKNNWFFESFLSPLLFVSFDVTEFVPDDMKKSVVKRLIVNTEFQEQKDFFDETYKGRNDIDFQDVQDDLEQRGIGFFFDEEILDLPVSIMRFIGNFNVLKVIDENIEETVDGETITIKRRKYKLDKIEYTDSLSGFEDSKTLITGDTLLTSDGSKYVISSIDSTDNTVILKRSSGFQSITIGANILNIQSPPFSSKEIQVNIGFNERQIIFFKPIDDKFDVTSSEYSPGVGFFSNELEINTADGIVSLETFYKNNVVDFGQQFINAAKDQVIPAVLAEVPDPPTLEESNFKIVQINLHKKDTQEVEEIKTKLSQKSTIKQDIQQIDESINLKKDELNNSTVQRSPAQRRKIRQDLDRLARNKVTQTNLFSSVVRELSTRVIENPVITEKPKFRVRGFWAIPEAKQSEQTNPQEVIQFKIQFRFLRKDGNTTGTEQIEFVDTDGTTTRGFFSNWNEVKTDIRERFFNQDTGFFEWMIEDVEDADTPNINQLDLPISRGEQIEFRITSISEAGWPSNPIESDFSESIIIDFPEDLEVGDESEFILREATREEARVDFQDELNARGLDIHLLTSFTSGDKFFAHEADVISSGFFTTEGNVVDLFQKLKSIDDELTSLRELITAAKGTLVVFLLDEDGGITKITPNSTTKIFAGFYKDEVTDSQGNIQHGNLVTKTFTLRLQNSSATPLELVSALPGGFEEILDPSATSTDEDFKNNRKYDLVPIALTGLTVDDITINSSIKQVSPFQSTQVKSQFIYQRFKNIGLDKDLYNAEFISSITLDNPDVEFDHYLIPDITGANISGGVNANIWDGVAATTPSGNGNLTEFSIHIDHPDIVDRVADDLTKPRGTDQFDNSDFYPLVGHARLFNRASNENSGQQQIEYSRPTEVSTGNNFTDSLAEYPVRLGFAENDEFLVGKFTCGSYLFLSPPEYNNILVEGSTALANKIVEFGDENAINIPMVYQFRCSDKLEFIGGWRGGRNLRNVTYIKKLGLDVQVRNEAPFSFDVEVSCKFTRDSLTRPNFLPSVSEAPISQAPIGRA